MTKKNELGEWLEEFTVTCGVCGKPYRSALNESQMHCSQCTHGLAALMSVVTAKDEETMTAGRGYYVATMFEAVMCRLDKLDKRVKELEAGK